jgi:trimethylamine---corrinoid protein Co-methyltransferase
MPLQSNYTSYDTPRFRKLSDDQVERLHHASLEILDRTGIRLYEPEALELLEKKGVHPEDGNRVRIPPGLVGMGSIRGAKAGRPL